jgi:hypothetical protein
MMTRNGIVYKLELSPYSATIEGITYMFSSVNHMEKFLEKINENREIISYSLSKRFNVNINFGILSDIVLYAKIETRGFLIKHKGEIFSCKKDIILNGATLMKKN